MMQKLRQKRANKSKKMIYQKKLLTSLKKKSRMKWKTLTASSMIRRSKKMIWKMILVNLMRPKKMLNLRKRLDISTKQTKLRELRTLQAKNQMMIISRKTKNRLFKNLSWNKTSNPSRFLAHRKKN